MTRLQQRGVAGMVSDGSVRDAGPISSMGLPVYSKSRSAMINLSLHHAVDINVPIGCAGVPIYPGDILVGDSDGVVCIPQHLAAEVAKEAVEMEMVEQFVLGRIRDGAPLRGTYPPDEQTLRLFRESTMAVEESSR